MSARNYIKQLAELPTPFYFYDMELLNRTLNKATEASSRYGYKIHYALKSNFDPRIVEAVRRAGMGMDCVSGNEVRMAVENGFAASEIVFAGVGKTDREIEYALGQEIFSFNCESLHELQVINEIAGRMGKKARIALRINPDVDPKTHRYITTGKADNKFGISYDEIDAAIASLEKLANLEIVGLHFHIGSQIRDMQVFETFSKRVFDIKEWFREKGIVLKHLNMGGGLGIDYDDPDREPMPDFETYFDIFHRNLKIDEDRAFRTGPLAGRAVRRIDYARALQQRNVGRYEDRDRRRRNDRPDPAGPVRRETQDRKPDFRDRERKIYDRRPDLRIVGYFRPRRRTAGHLARRPADAAFGRGLRHGDGIALQSAGSARSRIQR